MKETNDLFKKPYCPSCRSFLTDNEIVSAIRVSRGREYKWEICFRCNCPVQTKAVNISPKISLPEKIIAEAVT